MKNIYNPIYILNHEKLFIIYLIIMLLIILLTIIFVIKEINKKE